MSFVVVLLFIKTLFIPSSFLSYLNKIAQKTLSHYLL